MPLDFSNPRPRSTLSHPRERADLVAISRDLFPRPDIVAGLREVGGYWTARSHQEMERIRRYVDEMKAEETSTLTATTAALYTLYAPAEFPTAQEIAQLVEAVMAKSDMYLHREENPEISIHPTAAAKMMIMRVKDQKTKVGTDMAINSEDLSMAMNPHSVISQALEDCFHRIYRARAMNKIKIEQH